MQTARVAATVAVLNQRLRCTWLFASVCSFLLLGLMPTAGFAQVNSVLCDHGEGHFAAYSHAAVNVTISPERKEELARRACRATLGWGKMELVVAGNAAQIDLDVFGSDMNGAGPVAAFQVKDNSNDCCMTYRIYALSNPPKLLRIITGGETFSAADTDLDGRVEIWTSDAQAVNGFEGIPAEEMKWIPAVVLRFERGRLADVSGEFQPYFDGIIAKLRAENTAEDLQKFKQSDGILRSGPPVGSEDYDRLKATKMRTLGIVCAYLYSGREQEAWRWLQELWPEGDVERIRSAIVKVRAGGIRTQVDGSSGKSTHTRKQSAWIYESWQLKERPRAILLRGYELVDPDSLIDTEVKLDLVIDSAGKVRSAAPADPRRAVEDELLQSALQWKFTPAFKDNHSVACRFRLGVSAMQ